MNKDGGGRLISFLVLTEPASSHSEQLSVPLLLARVHRTKVNYLGTGLTYFKGTCIILHIGESLINLAWVFTNQKRIRGGNTQQSDVRIKYRCL